MTDPLSVTARGRPWPNHEWLSQILFYGFYRLGGAPALVALAAAIITATWVAIIRLCTGSPRIWTPLLAIGVISHSIVWSVRPHLFSLLGVAVLLLLLRYPRAQISIPPLFLIWANLHGGVAFGGAILLVGAASALYDDRRFWPRWAVLVAASALATLCTPMGIGLWGFALSMVAHPETTYIREWLPPSINWPVSYPFFLLAFVWVAVLALCWRDLARRLVSDDRAWTLTLLVIGLAMLSMGFRAIRHTTLFTLVALPLICDLLRYLDTSVGLKKGAEHASPTHPLAEYVSLKRGIGHAIGLVLAGFLALALVIVSWSEQESRIRPLSDGAIAAVRACPGTLYNTYTLGGPVLWFIPERLVFVDSRNDPYPLDLLYDAVRVEQSGSYADLFARYHVNCAIVGRRVPLATTLAAAPDWALTYDGDQVLVFAHK